MEKLHILITVPHSGCIYLVDPRMCDTRSKEAATLLYLLFKEKEISTSLHLAETEEKRPILRSEIDLNRHPAIYTKWYQKIEKLIQRNQKMGLKTIILDCHSFPHEKMKMMLFKTPGVFDPIMDLFKDLKTKLGMVKLICGSKENFITQQATLLHIPSILIEFNEFDIVFPRNELEWTCRKIVEYTLKSPEKLILPMSTEEKHKRDCSME